MTVQQLLSNRDRWVQRKTAVDKQGLEVDPRHPDACRWCIVAAIYRCYRAAGARHRALDRLRAIVPLPVEWNDNPRRTFTEVKRVIVQAEL